MDFLRRRWILLAGLLALAIYVQWQMIGVPPMPRLTARAEEVWSLPQAPPAQPAKAIETLIKTQPWGPILAAGSQSASGPGAWRIAGIFTRGEERVVVIRTDKEPTRQLKVGDTLPNGATIEAIRENSISIVEDGKKRNLAIYPRRRTS